MLQKFKNTAKMLCMPNIETRVTMVDDGPTASAAAVGSVSAGGSGILTELVDVESIVP